MLKRHGGGDGGVSKNGDERRSKCDVERRGLAGSAAKTMGRDEQRRAASHSDAACHDRRGRSEELGSGWYDPQFFSLDGVSLNLPC